jgi:hypothetical protein
MHMQISEYLPNILASLEWEQEKNFSLFNELRKSTFAPYVKTVRSFAEFNLPRKFNDEK